MRNLKSKTFRTLSRFRYVAIGVILLIVTGSGCVVIFDIKEIEDANKRRKKEKEKSKQKTI